jgi:hypothetical protein
MDSIVKIYENTSDIVNRVITIEKMGINIRPMVRD